MDHRARHVLRASAACVVGVLVTWFAMPSRIGSAPWFPAPRPALEGALAENTVLEGADPVQPGQLPGAGDLTFDREGRLVCALGDGRIVRVEGNHVVDLVHTGGKPHGLHFAPDGSLYVADAKLGLVRVDVERKTSEVVVREVEGIAFHFLNGIDVASDGVVYFTDSSTTWNVHQYAEDLLDQRPTGRVLRYDPRTRTTLVIAREIGFANGVALSHDEQSLLVSETSRYRVWRVWLSGDKRNLKEMVASNLPGFPDNISRTPRGTYWVALYSLRKRALDLIHPYPFLKDAVATLPHRVQPGPMRWGFVVEMDETGRVLRTLQDPDGFVVDNVTSAVELDGRLWMGNLEHDWIWRLTLPPAPTSTPSTLR